MFVGVLIWVYSYYYISVHNGTYNTIAWEIHLVPLVLRSRLHNRLRPEPNAATPRLLSLALHAGARRTPRRPGSCPRRVLLW